jgi:hypothetical protein
MNDALTAALRQVAAAEEAERAARADRLDWAKHGNTVMKCVNLPESAPGWGLEQQLDLEVFVGWTSPSSRGLWAGNRNPYDPLRYNDSTKTTTGAGRRTSQERCC